MRLNTYIHESNGPVWILLGKEPVGKRIYDDRGAQTPVRCASEIKALLLTLRS